MRHHASMRLACVLCLLALAACSSGDGETWSVQRATGLFSGLAGCDCKAEERMQLAPSGRFATVSCTQSAHGPLTLFLRMPRAERTQSTGLLEVDGVPKGSVFLDRAMGEKQARFKGSNVETPYRFLYVRRLVFDGAGPLPAGSLDEGIFACDTFQLDSPKSPFFSEAFGEPSP